MDSDEVVHQFLGTPVGRKLRESCMRHRKGFRFAGLLVVLAMMSWALLSNRQSLQKAFWSNSLGISVIHDIGGGIKASDSLDRAVNQKAPVRVSGCETSRERVADVTQKWQAEVGSNALLLASYLFYCGARGEALAVINDAMAAGHHIDSVATQVLRYYRGSLHYEAGDTTYALEDWRFVPGLDVFFARAGSGSLANDRRALGLRYYELSELLTPGVQPYRIELYWTKCRESADNSDWEQAQLYCEQTVEIDRHPAYVKMLGRAYTGVGQFERAIGMYTEVLASNENDGEAYYGRGIVLREAGRLVEAETDLRKAIEFSPSNAWARIALGDILNAAGQSEEARTMYSEAIRTEDSFAAKAASDRLQAMEQIPSESRVQP